MTMKKQTRRDFLKTGAMSTMLLGTGMFVGPACTTVREKGEAKNIIFLVSDGMSAGTLTMADVMRRRQEGRVSNWIRLYEEGTVRRGLMDMAAADAIVTDSAAAAASWGCGHRVNNGYLNIGPDGTHHKPIQSIFRDAGKATGLVTTTEITHATPAGFAANVESRNYGETIAEQYLEREVDLLLGGAHRHLSGDLREDGADLYEQFRQKGYHIARQKSEMEAGNGRLLGVFSNGHLPYSLDHRQDSRLMETVPTLAEMTDLALRKLSSHPDGFLLQVEGGRVDHAAHGNDVGGLIHDQIAFDDAIGVAMAFAENRDDTLVIITTDHGNANPGFSYSPDEHFDQIYEFTQTNWWIMQELNENSSVLDIRERIETATGLGIATSEADVLRRSLRGEYSAIYSLMNTPRAILGQIIANHTHVNWISGTHTADYVELAAFGPGSEALEGFVINTHLFDVMVEAAGVMDYTTA